MKMKYPFPKWALSLVVAGQVLVGLSGPLSAAETSASSTVAAKRCSAPPAPYSSVLGTKIPLTLAEQELVMNLKPGQTAEKRIIIAPDAQTGTQNCCKQGDCCCTCQCDPAPCICTCTDEIIVK